MFCSRCGKKMEGNHLFCSQCGTSVGVNSHPAPSATFASQPKKTNRKKIIVGIGVAVAVVLIIGILYGVLSKAVPKRVDFNLHYNREDIQGFMEVVCENADLESAKVVRVGYAGFGLDYGTYLAATLRVKPYGMVEEEIQVRFFNTGDTDMVSGLVVYYYDHDTENEIACRDAIVKSIEISLCDDSRAKNYTSDFDAIGESLTIYDDEQILESYFLTSDIKVTISCDGSFGDEWTGKYRISKTQY